MMGYLASWKAQEKMIADLRKKGVVIPEKVMDDLKTARTLMRIPKTHTAPENATPDVEVYLTSVESFIITEAEKHFGSKCADEWLWKLERARKTSDESEERTRLVPGIPRGKRWIRIRPTDKFPLTALKMMADGLGLSYKAQQENCLLVYGEDKLLKEFIARMAAKQSLKTP